MKLSDCLHFYLGCECIKTESGTRGKLARIGESMCNLKFSDEIGQNVSFMIEEVKPILRPLSSMTEEEAVEFCKIETTENRHHLIEIHEVKQNEVWYSDGSRFQGDGIDELNDLFIHFNHLSANQFAWLLSKSFDLFGLIESNQAIDSSTLNP